MDAAEYRKPCTAINRFTAGEKTVTVYKGTKDDRVVYFNTYGEQGGEVWDIMRGCGASLVTIADLDWNRDMSPWGARAEPIPDWQQVVPRCVCRHGKRPRR